MNCWWCCHPPAPLHLPLDYKNNEFKTMGHFCSWECMKAWTLKNISQSKCGNVCMFINLMRVKHYGGDPRGVIKRAPSPYCLKTFGGSLDIKTFRKSNHNTVKVTFPNESHKLHTVHVSEPEHTRLQSGFDTKNKLESINNASGENDSLKLKRNKPLRNHVKNNLEDTLGLKKKKTSLFVGGS